MRATHTVSYIGLAVLAAMLTVFNIELAQGLVPIPPDWQWVAPIISAGIVAVTVFLPRAGTSSTEVTVTRSSTATPDTPAPPLPAVPNVPAVTVPKNWPSTSTLSSTPTISATQASG